MSNITLAIEQELLQSIKSLAAKNGVSVNSLVKNYFESLIDSGVSKDGEMNGNLKTLFEYSIGKISRFQAKKRLGIQDLVLAEMLREAGFPLPRVPESEELEMLKEIQSIRL